MANTDIKVPFKYCRIERAAKYLKCEISDLINGGVNGKLSLCLKLNNVQGMLLASSPYERMNSWVDSLSYGGAIANSLVKNLTPYSFYKFDNIYIQDNGEAVVYPYFNGDENNNDTIKNNSCAIGRAYGLWRIHRSLEHIENKGIAYIDGTEFTPCSPTKDMSNMQFIIDENLSTKVYTLEDDSDYHGIIDRDTFENIAITHADLWIADIDIKRVIEKEYDFDALDIVHHYDVLINKKDKDKIKEPHHTAERHAINREQVLMAAMRFREECPNVFDEECRKADRSINFAAWAREIISRPFLFPNHELTIKTEDKIAAILSNAHKAPNDRK
ncbi:hypothetical protein [Xenorhabdus bovienii]|uniref:hypothetical protein n=1 Tax=Xenorhabdus bovienii TaxID=40576 RepID=UPI0004DB1069|nr:hypothetical protein [Xenorhabdus bovienii]CDG86854.1 conserved hypothetical protein [Xenorhabdus bovienii str. feltiae France]CDG92182.1 conserved hypothetical protein [Xenorhabdus bovienii str. feltiae Florida]